MKWDGKHKKRIRDYKLSFLEKWIDNKNVSNTYVLTLPGNSYAFESGLIERNITQDNKIIGIQRYNRDKNVYLEVIKSMPENLSNMIMFSGNFEDFSDIYCEFTDYEKLYHICNAEIEASLPIRNSFYNWLIMSRPFPQINIFDIDLCSPFYPNIAESIISLFQGGIAASKGVLFITHMKSRDGIYYGADYIKKHISEILEKDSLSGINNEEMRFYCYPMYYIYLASVFGYELKLKKVFEYKNNDSETRKGNPMLQYIFLFEKKEKNYVYEEEIRNIKGYFGKIHTKLEE